MKILTCGKLFEQSKLKNLLNQMINNNNNNIIIEKVDFSTSTISNGAVYYDNKKQMTNLHENIENEMNNNEIIQRNQDIINEIENNEMIYQNEENVNEIERNQYLISFSFIMKIILAIIFLILAFFY